MESDEARKEYAAQVMKKMTEDAIAELSDPVFKERIYSIKTGDRVTLNHEIRWYNPPLLAGSIGTATIDWPLDEEDPIVGHGAIAVVFDDYDIEEHFVMWRWWESLTKVEE